MEIILKSDNSKNNKHLTTKKKNFNFFFFFLINNSKQHILIKSLFMVWQHISSVNKYYAIDINKSVIYMWILHQDNAF